MTKTKCTRIATSVTHKARHPQAPLPSFRGQKNSSPLLVPQLIGQEKKDFDSLSQTPLCSGTYQEKMNAESGIQYILSFTSPPGKGRADISECIFI